MRTAPAVVLALLGLVACTKKDEAAASGEKGAASSCDLSQDVGYCLEFDASAPAEAGKKNCENAKAMGGLNNGVAGTSCPTGNRVGTCVAMQSGLRTTTRYYAGKWDAAKAQTNCKALGGGTGQFTPG